MAVLSEVAAGALAEVTITEVDENASSAVAKVILLETAPLLVATLVLNKVATVAAGAVAAAAAVVVVRPATTAVELATWQETATKVEA